MSIEGISCWQSGKETDRMEGVANRVTGKLIGSRGSSTGASGSCSSKNRSVGKVKDVFSEIEDS
ncbi:hypothetical protein CP061683_1452 [Chlamydia psittaci 06-1683]|nr:hypothetical protein CP061683_1452 [Chlamydia psittaci 06-1683]